MYDTVTDTASDVPHVTIRKEGQSILAVYITDSQAASEAEELARRIIADVLNKPAAEAEAA